jgi:hypothetical protein
MAPRGRCYYYQAMEYSRREGRRSLAISSGASRLVKAQRVYITAQTSGWAMEVLAPSQAPKNNGREFNYAIEAREIRTSLSDRANTNAIIATTGRKARRV